MSEQRAEYKAKGPNGKLATIEPPLKLSAPMVDVRHNCGRLLFRAVIPHGLLLEIRCPKCGQLHIIDTRLTSVL